MDEDPQPKRTIARRRKKELRDTEDMIRRHVVQLSEHLTSIQIVGTQLQPNGKTIMFSMGSGDLLARVKVAEVWIDGQNQILNPQQ